MFASITVTGAVLAIKILVGIILAMGIGGGGFILWQNLITIPRLETEVANGRIHEANAKTCFKANDNIAKSLDKTAKVVDGMHKDFLSSRGETAKALGAMATITADVEAKLKAFKPDPTKSDCENAMAELQIFRQEQKKGGKSNGTKNP